MPTETLTQSGHSLSDEGGIDFAAPMTDLNNVSQSVNVEVPNSMITFPGWGPSTGSLSNVVTSGNGGGGNPGHVTFDVSGTGNITGNGNDDVYSGSGSFDLSWTTEGTPKVTARNGKISLTYTD
jgi:hypothetical protein